MGFESNGNFHSKNEYPEYDVRSYVHNFSDDSFVGQKLREWVSAVESMRIPDQIEMYTITANTRNGISMYIFFKNTESGNKFKIRISNHKASKNNSHCDMDLRGVSDLGVLEDYLSTKI